MSLVRSLHMPRQKYSYFLRLFYVSVVVGGTWDLQYFNTPWSEYESQLRLKPRTIGLITIISYNWATLSPFILLVLLFTGFCNLAFPASLCVFGLGCTKRSYELEFKRDPKSMWASEMYNDVHVRFRSVCKYITYAYLCIWYRHCIIK